MVFILQKKPCSACLQSPEQFQAYPHRNDDKSSLEIASVSNDQEKIIS